jgi:hypothetical protein
MEPRELYEVLFNSRGPAGEPKGEWIFVGDSQCFDTARFAEVASVLPSSRVYVAVSRTQGCLVESEALPQVAQDYLNNGEVRVADEKLRVFIQVSPIGVARTWTASST